MSFQDRSIRRIIQRIEEQKLNAYLDKLETVLDDEDDGPDPDRAYDEKRERELFPDDEEYEEYE